MVEGDIRFCRKTVLVILLSKCSPASSIKLKCSLTYIVMPKMTIYIVFVVPKMIDYAMKLDVCHNHAYHIESSSCCSHDTECKIYPITSRLRVN